MKIVENSLFKRNDAIQYIDNQRIVRGLFGSGNGNKKGSLAR
jgi:hypothetical protein